MFKHRYRKLLTDFILTNENRTIQKQKQEAHESRNSYLTNHKVLVLSPFFFQSEFCFQFLQSKSKNQMTFFCYKFQKSKIENNIQKTKTVTETDPYNPLTSSLSSNHEVAIMLCNHKDALSMILVSLVAERYRLQSGVVQQDCQSYAGDRELIPKNHLGTEIRFRKVHFTCTIIVDTITTVYSNLCKEE